MTLVFLRMPPSCMLVSLARPASCELEGALSRPSVEAALLSLHAAVRMPDCEAFKIPGGCIPKSETPLKSEVPGEAAMVCNTVNAGGFKKFNATKKSELRRPTSSWRRRARWPRSSGLLMRLC